MSQDKVKEQSRSLKPYLQVDLDSHCSEREADTLEIESDFNGDTMLRVGFRYACKDKRVVPSQKDDSPQI